MGLPYRSVVIENFKGHVHTELELGKLTVLVGPNGSGKSSTLEVIRALSTLDEGALLQQFIAGLSPRVGADFVRLLVSGDEPSAWGVTLELRIDVANKAGWPWKPTVRWNPSTGGGLAGPVRPHPVVLGRNRATMLGLAANAIARPSNSSELAPTGAGVATRLANLKLADDPAYSQIQEDLRAVVPTLRAVKPQRGADGHDRLVFDFVGATGIAADQVSEGTLLALGLLTFVHASDSKLLLLDDLERGLHPQAQIELIQLIQAIVEKRGDIQIVATTHSPYLLDKLDPEQVWVFAIGPDGAPKCRRLSEHPQAQERTHRWTAGEMWTAEDESWVLKPHA